MAITGSTGYPPFSVIFLDFLQCFWHAFLLFTCISELSYAKSEEVYRTLLQRVQSYLYELRWSLFTL